MLMSILAVVAACATAGRGVVYQHTYDLREERVTIPGARQPLQGVLALPGHGEGPFGLVVFVHGDGPRGATGETFYRPIWESFAAAGYASLSWGKPGINGAQGNWLDQSMADRAAETLAAIEWARMRTRIDPDRIGLWGASQAGWVLPEVAAQDSRLRFMIAVSPAVNWLQQGRYNTLAELRERGATRAEVDDALTRREHTLTLLERAATFPEAEAAGVTGLTANRWRFIQKNYTADATADLAQVRIPVLLILAEHDLNVDIADTERTYRAQLARPDQLQVRRYSDARHSLVRKSIEDSAVKPYLIALAAPRKLFAEGFWPTNAASSKTHMPARELASIHQSRGHPSVTCPRIRGARSQWASVELGQAYHES
ncbi:alpha/beta hydrolase family protein [Nocardia sp. bgisy134]|uniref:alpha/beta hydrolase family protein n=1 Tax=Nocardia sp. bgisy134 TaxID=3413789 RepID=UPI003D7366CA